VNGGGSAKVLHNDTDAACSIVARNYTAYANVLYSSFVKHNPGMHFATLLIDGVEADRGTSGVGTVVLPEDLGMASEDLESMIVTYTVIELATALKPAMLRYMRSLGHRSVLYLDPDILVLGPLGTLVTAAADHAVALTPHTLEPLPRDGLEISELTIRRAGIFNLGFIAVGPGSEAFLEWWSERLRLDAVIDFEHALFTDQRWIDWVPALFAHVILRDPGLNVAYWNIHERLVDGNVQEGYTANGQPLRFFHFSGFDASTPWHLSRFTGDDPRVLVFENDALAALCADYARALIDYDHEERRRFAYGHGDLAGVRMTPDLRRTYRDALRGAVPLAPPPSRPLTDPSGFRTWLSTRVACTPWSALSPVEVALWRSRADLRSRFPSPFGSASRYYRTWLDESTDLAEYHAFLGLAAPAAPAAPVGRLSGWSVLAAGDPEPSGELRLLADRIGWEVARAGLPYEIVDAPPVRAAGWVPWRHRGPGAGDHHGNLVVMVDAEHFSEDRIVQALVDRAGVRIAVWACGDHASADQVRVLSTFDEIWVLGTAAADELAAQVPRPVVRVALPDAAAHRQGTERRAVAGGGTARFLVPVDAAASVARQDPAAAIDAYVETFGSDEGCTMTVHVHHGGLSRRARESIAHASRGRPDVVVEEQSDATSLPKAIASATAVVGLPRSRVLGTTLRDAVELGVPVVVNDDVVSLAGLVSASIHRPSSGAPVAHDSAGGDDDGPLSPIGRALREAAGSAAAGHTDLAPTATAATVAAVGARLLELTVGPLGTFVPDRPETIAR